MAERVLYRSLLRSARAIRSAGQLLPETSEQHLRLLERQCSLRAFVFPKPFTDTEMRFHEQVVATGMRPEEQLYHLIGNYAPHETS